MTPLALPCAAALLLLAAAGVVFPPGSRLHVQPDATSLSVAVIDEEVELEPFEVREGWYRVRYLDRTGWIRKGPTYSLLAERGGAVVPPWTGDEELLSEIRASFPGPVQEIGLGPILLVTDVVDPRLGKELADAVARARTGMALRFGLALPDGRGSVLVVRSRSAESPAPHGSACGRAALRVGVTSVGGSVAGDTADRILHQAGHLFAAGALGEGVPPWLEEGLAEALEEAAWSEQRRATAFPVPAASEGLPPGCGPDRPRLAGLLRSGPELFHPNAEAACLRRQSADLVRFLSDGGLSSRPSRFRSFLKDVIAGEARLDTPTLLEYLDEDLPALEKQLLEKRSSR